MKLFKQISLSTMAILLSAGLQVQSADAGRSLFANPPPAYLLQINGHNFSSRNAHVRRPPASLTKIMTAMIIMENLDPDEVVTVTRSAARETGSRIGIRRGERFTVRSLLAATLLASANDACRALADHAGGSQRAFVSQMNQRAKSLHLNNTRFSNACGHDEAGLYSTPADLAVLTGQAMRLPLFAELVSCRSMRIKTVNGSRSFYLRNKNRLIGRYPGALGVKTGTTPNAGQCLVALAERKHRKVLLVIMHSRNRWRAAPAMLDAAFAASSTAITHPVQPALELQDASRNHRLEYGPDSLSRKGRQREASSKKQRIPPSRPSPD